MCVGVCVQCGGVTVCSPCAAEVFVGFLSNQDYFFQSVCLFRFSSLLDFVLFGLRALLPICVLFAFLFYVLFGPRLLPPKCVFFISIFLFPGRPRPRYERISFFRALLTQSVFLIENGLCPLKPKSGFLIQSKTGIFDATFFD